MLLFERLRREGSIWVISIVNHFEIVGAQHGLCSFLGELVVDSVGGAHHLRGDAVLLAVGLLTLFFTFVIVLTKIDEFLVTVSHLLSLTRLAGLLRHQL